MSSVQGGRGKHDHAEEKHERYLKIELTQMKNTISEIKKTKWDSQQI